MSEYIVQRDSLVNVADEIRVLSGTTAELGLDEMASNVADANTDVETMAGLIEELEAALEGKSVEGSGATVETCTVNGACTLNQNNILFVTYETQDGIYTIKKQQSFLLENVVCGSPVIIVYNRNYNCNITTDNIELVTREDPELTFASWFYLVFQAPETSGTATITIVDED